MTLIVYLQQIPYVIGKKDPLPIRVDAYNTSKKTNEELHEIIEKNFDLHPGEIIK